MPKKKNYLSAPPPPLNLDGQTDRRTTDNSAVENSAATGTAELKMLRLLI